MEWIMGGISMDLEGDNESENCGDLHMRKVSLMHWSA